MVSRCGRGICSGPSTQTHTCKMLVLRPDLLVKLPSFSVSSCTIPGPPPNMDSGYFQFYLAGKLLICGGSAQCYRMQTGGWVVDSTLPAARSSSSGVSLPPGPGTAIVAAGWVQGERSSATHIYDGKAWSLGPSTSTPGRVAHCQVTELAGRQPNLSRHCWTRRSWWRVRWS